LLRKLETERHFFFFPFSDASIIIIIIIIIIIMIIIVIIIMIIKKQYSSYNKNLSVRTGIEQLESTSDISKVRFRKKRDFYRVTIYSFIYAN